LEQFDVFQDTDRRRALVNAVIYGGISVTAEQILTVQKEFCFMELDN